MSDVMEYPFSVFDGFTKAVGRADSDQWRSMLNVVRVAVSDDNKRCAALWKEIGRGNGI